MDQIKVDKLMVELMKIREILSLDLTNLTSDTVDSSISLQKRLAEIKEKFSSLASAVTTLVVDNEAEVILNQVETEHLQKITDFAKQLGNMQYKLHEVNKKFENIEKEANKLMDDGIDLGNDAAKLQENAIEIAHVFKNLGTTVPRSDIGQFMHA